MSGRILDDRYSLQRVLGRGGMAEVWRAVDLRLDRPVAVKILNTAGRADPVALQRLHREARTVARLDHPHIVAVHDVNIADDGAFLVMELVEGGSLADLLARGGPLPVRQAVTIAAQTCDALAAAHAAGIVHRDIKPANLLLTPSGTVKLCDFGIARLAHAGSGATLTHPGTVIGTAAYMAPEQAVGDPTGPPTDLYALGCVLYAMLTGAPPFGGENPIAVLQQHLNQAPPALPTGRMGMAPQLDRLVGELLAKNPAERPADAANVRDRLEQLADTVTASKPRAGVAPLPTLTMPAQPASAASPSAADELAEPVPMSPLRRVGVGRVATVLAAVAVAGAVAIVLIVASMSGPSGDGAGAAGNGAGTPVESGTVAVSTSPTPAQTSQSQTPSDQLTAIDAKVADLADNGRLDAGAAKGLRKDLADVGRQIGRDRYKQAAERVDDLRQQVSKLYRSGKLDAAGQDMLATSLDTLAASLPDDDSDKHD